MIVTVDTGGTKTLVAAFTNKGEMTSHIKFPTPKNQVKYIALLHQSCEDLKIRGKVDVVSVALPGIIKDDIAIWCKNLGWRNFDIKKQLGPIFNGAPIIVENDANLAGLSEARMMKPIPQSLLYVTVSTGIGTGFITEGNINPGMRYSEGGHALVEFDGSVREWEDFASGKAIYETYGEYASKITSKRRWQHIADRISRGFLAIIPIAQPDVVVIGGSMGSFFDRYEKHLVGLLEERLPPHINRPLFIQARHPEHAVAYGGYYHAIDYLSNKKA